MKRKTVGVKGNTIHATEAEIHIGKVGFYFMINLRGGKYFIQWNCL